MSTLCNDRLSPGRAQTIHRCWEAPPLESLLLSPLQETSVFAMQHILNLDCRGAGREACKDPRGLSGSVKWSPANWVIRYFSIFLFWKKNKR